MNINDTFIWFFGVVEDIDDPLLTGRVRVRCFNIHTEDLQLLPTSDLPWAQTILPTTSASMGDVGWSATGLLNGTWVFGFFGDGREKQRPFVLGTIPGLPFDKPDITKGFSDPNGFYPSRLEEPDVNRLVRNDEIKHNSIVFRNLLVDDLTEEPIPDRNSEYPRNKTWETETGHILEMDDTPGSNRTLRFHNSGTLEEIHPIGTRVNRVMTDNYHIVLGDDFMRVRGDVQVFIDGNSSVYVRNNATLQVDGNMNTYVGGDYTLDVTGKMTVTSKNAMAFKTSNTYSVSADKNYTLVASEVSLGSHGGSILFYSADDIFGYYCDNAGFFNICIPPSNPNVKVTTQPAKENKPVAAVNYGSEIPIYGNPGGAVYNPGTPTAPKKDGGPQSGSVVSPGISTETTELSKTLGSLSKKYESNDDPCIIGKEAAGWSYGSYQITTQVGTFKNFMDYLSKDHPTYHAILENGGGFDGAHAKSGAFVGAWSSICGDEIFEQAQHDFIQVTHYEHSKRLMLKLGIDLDKRSKTLKDVVWSTAVQHGPSTTVFKKSVAQTGVNGSDSALINAIYDERGITDSNGNLLRFRKSSPKVQAIVKKRFKDERADALGSL